jgi:CubicO group peptidase (beta-lactamase class C family)
MRALSGLLLAATLLPAPLVGQAADRFATVRGTIRRFLDSTGTASVAVAVAKDGKIVWEEGFGWANRERRIRADQHTMYSLASISKPITATGLMVLADRGLVDLDRPANDYLGLGKLTGLAGDAAQATLRRVLSHTAGLPLHYQFYYADRGYPPPSMDETIARYGNLVFPPGRLHEYSNLGFGIIDHIIARVSGQTYPDFMRTEVFLPLGLTRTSIDIGPGLEPYAAERYDDRQRPIPFYTFDHVGASAVYSSAHDLVRFGMFHANNRLAEQRAILKPATIDEMHRPVAPASYGLGFRVAPDDMGLLRYGHGGGMPGVATTLNIYPAENLVVVVLTNGGDRPEVIAQDLAAAMVPRYADSLRARRARSSPPPQSTVIPAAVVGEWEGTVRTWDRSVPLRLEVRANGEAFAWLGDQSRAVVNQLVFANDRLTGRFAGAIPTADVARWPHTIQVGLELIGGVLKGQVSAQAAGFYSLASFTELRRR